MSLGKVINAMDNTPDPLKRLAAAVLGLAIDDLQTRKHQQSARRFLYSGECEVYAGVIGADFLEIYRRMKKNVERRGIPTYAPPKESRRPTDRQKAAHERQASDYHRRRELVANL